MPLHPPVQNIAMQRVPSAPWLGQWSGSDKVFLRANRGWFGRGYWCEAHEKIRTEESRGEKKRV